LGFGPLDGQRVNDNTTYNASAVFGMLGVAGFYNIDL
jgi:hypothetical protein